MSVAVMVNMRSSRIGFILAVLIVTAGMCDMQTMKFSVGVLFDEHSKARFDTLFLKSSPELLSMIKDEVHSRVEEEIIKYGFQPDSVAPDSALLILQLTLRLTNSNVLAVAMEFSDFRSNRKIPFKEQIKFGGEGDKILDTATWKNKNPIEIRANLQLIADSISTRVGFYLSGFILRSAGKAIIYVDPFAASGNLRDLDNIGEGFRSMVEKEMSKQWSLVVLQGKPGERIATSATYVIQGSVMRMGDELRVDIKCINSWSRRILTGKTFVTKNGDAINLSGQLAQSCGEMRQSIENDFRGTSQRNVAVLPTAVDYIFDAAKVRDKFERKLPILVAKAVFWKIQTLKNNRATVTLPGMRSWQLHECNDPGMLDRFTREPVQNSKAFSLLPVDEIVFVTITEPNFGQVSISAKLVCFNDGQEITDILYRSGVHPRRKLGALVDSLSIRVFNHLSEVKSGGPDAPVGMVSSIKNIKIVQPFPSYYLYVKPLGIVFCRTSNALFLGKETSRCMEIDFFMPSIASQRGVLWYGLTASGAIDWGTYRFPDWGIQTTNAMLGARFSLNMMDIPIVNALEPMGRLFSGIQVGEQFLRYSFDTPNPGRGSPSTKNTKAVPSFAGLVGIELPQFFRMGVFFLEYQFARSMKEISVPSPVTPGTVNKGYLGGNFFYAGIRFSY